MGWKWRRSDEARKISGEFVPQTRCSVLKRALSDFQRGRGRWTSKSDHRWKTCVVTRLIRNQVVKILRLVSCQNLYAREKILYLIRSFILSQYRDLRTGSGVIRFWRFGDNTSKMVLDVLESFYLRLWDIIVQWVEVVKFRINDRSGDGTGSSKVKIRTNTVKFTNMIIARLRESMYLVKESNVFIKDKTTKLRAEWVVTSEHVFILASVCGGPMRRNSVLEKLRLKR